MSISKKALCGFLVVLFNISVSQQSLAIAPSNNLCSDAIPISAAGPFPYQTTLVADITDATNGGTCRKSQNFA